MSFDYVFQNAVRLHEQGKLDEAEAVYRQLLEIAPENTDLLHLLGMVAMQRRAFDSAIDLLYKATRLAPDTVAYEFTLAQALQDAGHPKEALEHYHKVLSLDDTLPETYHNMGIIARFQGDIDESERLFKKAIDLRPEFSSAYVNLGLLARDKGDETRAMDYFDKAVAVDAENPEAYAQRAVTHRLAGRYEQALAEYERALALAPDTPLYLNGLGITYERLERLDDAFHAYCRAIELNPSFPDAYNNRANVYVKYGKHWEAEDDYKKAVRLDPQFASAYNNLGALLYDHERFEEALECYRKAFIINPKQAETSCNLAMAVKETGDAAEAVGLYFNALALNPSLTRVHHYLAQTLYDLYCSDAPDAKETALGLAKKWAQFFPDNAVAKHVCAAFEGKTTDTPEDGYVKELFDSFADSFDGTMQKIDYHVPELLAEYVKDLPDGLRILDAGCGTGLNAGVLRPHAKRLVGVDLSERMVDVAREKNLYDDLSTGDIVAFCREHPNAFDLVVLADVVCYFGDVSALLAAVSEALADKGRVFLTAEKGTEETTFALQPSGRFAHGERYLTETAERAGLSAVLTKPAVLRRENETEVAGIVFNAEKNEKTN